VSLIKAMDLGYVRFGAPDLSLMRQFLLDFGLSDVQSNRDEVLRMRSLSTEPYSHITELAGSGFLGVGLKASSIEDLRRICDHRHVKMQPIDAPGGGSKVTLVDPNGFTVDVVAGQEPSVAKDLRIQDDWNSAGRSHRPSRPRRVPAGPSTVLRLGHVVFLVNDLAATGKWWSDTFGLLVSDLVNAPDGNTVALFMRFDCGNRLVDHHALNFATVPNKQAQFHHAAFEVANLDSLMSGHDHLVREKYKHSWGIGRHILGSQVFDYWLDPFGNRVEHWTDGDVFSSADPPQITDLPTMLGTQWGPAVPPTFV
jgi:catechol 2,3-dioxygenase-like lactoylglutathione lyase family enzyme